MSELNTNGAIISIPMELRLFVKPGFDAATVQALIDKHFGIGEAIVGSGHYNDIAERVLNATIRDIEASDPDAGKIAQSVISELDLHRSLSADGPSLTFL